MMENIIDEIISKSMLLTQSPIVIYSKKILIKNLNVLISDISSSKNNIKLLYSVKACMNSSVIQEISNYVDGFSISSDSEFSVVKMFPNKYISATGFGFRKMLMDHKKKFYFNSLQQLEIFLESNKGISNLTVGLRIKAPEVLYNMNNDSRFGFSEHDLMLISKLKRKYSFRVTEILIHQENKVFNDYKILQKFIKIILENPVLKDVKNINLGGGWDNLFLKRQIGKFIDSLDIPTRYVVYIEPGSAIVRTIGVLKSKVIDESLSENSRTIVLDTSQFNNSSWYIPRIIGKVSDVTESEKIDTKVYGNTCYEKDYFGKYSNYRISFGDTVFLYPVGAYYNTTHRELHGLKFPKEYYL